MDVLMIGEPLAEFTSDAASPDAFARRLGGDTLNAAIYLARLRPDLRVGYLTRLGDDWMSLWMRDRIAAEGVDTSAIALEAGASPGLSFIRTDAAGERSFIYWRDQAAARRLLSGAGAAAEETALAQAGCVLFSGITLAILPEAARARLLAALARHRDAGGTVAYDTNYRARLWPSPSEAADWTARALAVTTLALPSTEDLSAIFGTSGAQSAMALCARHAAGEIALTDGGAPVLHRAASGLLQQVDLAAARHRMRHHRGGRQLQRGLPCRASWRRPAARSGAGGRPSFGARRPVPRRHHPQRGDAHGDARGDDPACWLTGSKPPRGNWPRPMARPPFPR